MKPSRPISLTPEGKAYVATLASFFTQLAAETETWARTVSIVSRLLDSES